MIGPAKGVMVKALRGFESLSLRQFYWLTCCPKNKNSKGRKATGAEGPRHQPGDAIGNQHSRQLLRRVKNGPLAGCDDELVTVLRANQLEPPPGSDRL